MAKSPSSAIPLLAGLVSDQVLPSAVTPARWQELVPVACRQQIGPMLYYVLQQADAFDALPESDAATLRAEYHQATAGNFLALDAAQEWSQHFGRAGITAVWLKGVPLSMTVFPQPGLRPMTDIDVLVSPQQASQALRLIETDSGRRPVGLSSSLDKHAVVQVGLASSVRMEVHWSLVDLPHQRVIEDVSWFLQQRLPLPGDDVFYGLTPEAHLLYLCGHAEIVHGVADFLLLRYLDLHRLVITSPGLDWGLLLDRAVDFGWTYAVERGLAIAQRLFATPLPDGLLAELRQRRPAHEDITRVTRHQAGGGRGQRLLNRFAGLSWPARLRLAAGLAFPSSQYMRSRYQLDAGWKVPFYYPYRWFDTGQAVLRILGKPHPKQPGKDR